MSINRILLVLLAVLLLSGGGAYAFKEVIPASEEVRQADSRQRTASKTESPKLTPSELQKNDRKKGIELRIPGIGYLGTLPRLDFGLELLYGAQKENEEQDLEGSGDVTLRGTVKHKF